MRNRLYINKKVQLLFCLVCSITKINSQTCTLVSTYFGGTQQDEIKSICIDVNKNSYVLGNTYSIDLPITPGKINDTPSGDYDSFLSKFDSCGILKWFTYIGTSGYDSGEKMTLTNDGNIVFCGYTAGVTSHTTLGCFQSVSGGGYDCFITKINPNGNIIWSTYFGKSGGDFAFDIKVDNYDNIVIGGTTTSIGLYTTVSSFQQIKDANTDAFIARFDKNGQLKWCTYYGGNGSEDIHALSIDKNYNIIGVGGSFSTNLNTSIGAHQLMNDGTMDGYIIKLDSNCVRIFSSYLGGSGIDDLWGNTTDALGNIYLSGHTTSTDFDLTPGAYQAINNGSNDWFITKFSPLGVLQISTLLGGTLNDMNTRMVRSGINELTLLGKTESANFPMIGASYQSLKSASYDVVIAKFSTLNLIPYWTSFYGGNGDEESWDLATITNSHFAFVGGCNSTTYPVSLSAYQPTLNISLDGIFTKLNIGNLIPNHDNDPIKNDEIINVDNLTPTNISSDNLNKNDNALFVYPNPAKESIWINSSIPFSYNFINILGEKIFSKTNITDTENMSIKHLINGIYFLTITTKQSIRTFKIIKED